MGIWLSIKRLTDKRPGLIVDEKGITDRSGEISAGFIPWSDIRAIKPVQVFNQSFLLFIINDPEVYINRYTNALKRKAAAANFRKYGSPVSIATNTLRYGFDELQALLNAKLAAYRQTLKHDY